MLKKNMSYFEITSLGKKYIFPTDNLDKALKLSKNNEVLVLEICDFYFKNTSSTTERKNIFDRCFKELDSTSISFFCESFIEILSYYFMPKDDVSKITIKDTKNIRYIYSKCIEKITEYKGSITKAYRILETADQNNLAKYIQEVSKKERKVIWD